MEANRMFLLHIKLEIDSAGLSGGDAQLRDIV